MKKLIFLIILSMFLKNVETKAQIPNGDFEALLYDGTLSNWGNITLFAVIIDSAGNTIQDSLIFDGPFCGVTTDAHSGNYALEMRNMFNYTANETINGWASVDEDSTYSAWGSLEFIYTAIQPQEFNFYYKFNSVNGDSGIARLAFYDAVGNIIGEANSIFSSTNTSYSYISIPIYYTSMDPVAYYSLNFSTYYSLADYPTGPNFGTRLTIDDITFSGTTGIAGMEDITEPILFPNPCTDFISVKNIERTLFKIYNLNGEVIQLGEIDAESKIVLKQQFAKGIYSLELNQGGKLQRKNFVIN
ncbi:MAG: T9SS type A sorting domain-containing protein [Bacteroidetes bacterium]|nr:T9SS type A sorting domain-containing protein [Bacteroidota bacterium]